MERIATHEKEDLLSEREKRRNKVGSNESSVLPTPSMHARRDEDESVVQVKKRKVGARSHTRKYRKTD